MSRLAAENALIITKIILAGRPRFRSQSSLVHRENSFYLHLFFSGVASRPAVVSEGQRRPHGYSGVLGFSQALHPEAYTASDAAMEFGVPAQPGDLILHVATMVHRAEPNRCERRQRRAIGAIFYGASARVDEVGHAARQEEIHKRAAKLKGQGARS